MIANVFAGVRGFPKYTYNAKVELRISIGLNQMERMFKQLIVNLLMIMAYSLFRKPNNLLVK